jgi:hypothetical protein
MDARRVRIQLEPPLIPARWCCRKPRLRSCLPLNPHPSLLFQSTSTITLPVLVSVLLKWMVPV